MYLINVKTLELEEFVDGEIPSYAILSHRWGKEELSFKEVMKGRANQQSAGFLKLKGACDIASSLTLPYLWIDTCCIDKRSSAELSEAINSMFRLYYDAAICIAYLSDVKEQISVNYVDANSNGDIDHVDFSSSIWFGRSWTLQELLAPSEIQFFDCNWKLLGTKNSLSDLVHATTKIPKKALLNRDTIQDYTISQRMFWASRRKATRVEDLAYCLLGIFNVNMPLLYGEGKKAFTRLQEEIIKYTADFSFLAWGVDRKDNSLLAQEPADFTISDDDIEFTSAQQAEHFAFNNIGLDIKLGLCWWAPEIYAVTIAKCDRRPPGVWTSTYVLLLRIDIITGHLFRHGLVKIEEGTRGVDMTKSTEERRTILRTRQSQPTDPHDLSFLALYLNDTMHSKPCRMRPIYHDPASYYDSSPRFRNPPIPLDDGNYWPCSLFDSADPFSRIEPTQTIRTQFEIRPGKSLFLTFRINFAFQPVLWLSTHSNMSDMDLFLRFHQGLRPSATLREYDFDKLEDAASPFVMLAFKARKGRAFAHTEALGTSLVVSMRRSIEMLNGRETVAWRLSLEDYYPEKDMVCSPFASTDCLTAASVAHNRRDSKLAKRSGDGNVGDNDSAYTTESEQEDAKPDYERMQLKRRAAMRKIHKEMKRGMVEMYHRVRVIMPRRLEGDVFYTRISMIVVVKLPAIDVFSLQTFRSIVELPNQ